MTSKPRRFGFSLSTNQPQTLESPQELQKLQMYIRAFACFPRESPEELVYSQIVLSVVKAFYALETFQLTLEEGDHVDGPRVGR